MLFNLLQKKPKKDKERERERRENLDAQQSKGELLGQSKMGLVWWIFKLWLWGYDLCIMLHKTDSFHFYKTREYKNIRPLDLHQYIYMHRAWILCLHLFPGTPIFSSLHLHQFYAMYHRDSNSRLCHLHPPDPAMYINCTSLLSTFNPNLINVLLCCVVRKVLEMLSLTLSCRCFYNLITLIKATNCLLLLNVYDDTKPHYQNYWFPHPTSAILPF